MLSRTAAFSLFTALMAFSGTAVIGEHKWEHDPFSDEFLPTCGPLALSGASPYFGKSISGGANASRSKVEMKERGEFTFCSLFEMYRSDISDFEGVNLSKYQPKWLEDPYSVGAAFNLWIEENRSSIQLSPSPSCVGVLKADDSVTEVLFSRAITIDDTARVIAVEITQSPMSYVDPDQGYTITLFAWASNAPAECVERE